MSTKVKFAQWGGRHIIYAPLYLAEQLGLLAKHGIEIELYPAGNDDEIFEEVASGRAHFGIGDPTFGAHSGRNPRGSKVVAGVIQKVCIFGVTHHPEIRELKSPEDLVALRVGTFPRPSTAFAVLNYLKRRHARRLRSMEIVECEIGSLVDALASGTADLVLELEPLVSLAVSKGLFAPLSLADFFPELLVTGVTASSEVLAEAPDVVQGLVSSLQRVLALLQEEPAAMISECQRMFPALTSDVCSQATQRLLTLGCWPAQVSVSPLAWENALMLRKEMGDAISQKQASEVLEMEYAYKALTLA
jgi:NitT/TauT family transport system substrate-binding protein